MTSLTDGSSTTSYWSGVTGDWGTAGEWSDGIPNGATTDAVIAPVGSFPGSYMVTIGSAESFTVGAVTLGDSNATLDIAGTLNVTKALYLNAGALVANGGTIQGGTIVIGSSFTAPIGGTLNDVAIQGTLVAGGLFIGDGISFVGASGTGPGALVIGDTTVGFDDNETLDNVNILMGYGNSASLANLLSYNGHMAVITSEGGFTSYTLTIGAHATLTSQGNVGLGDYPSEGFASRYEDVVNDGLINATAASSTFIIGGEDVTNNGTIFASNGGTLSISAIEAVSGIGEFVNSTGAVIDIAASTSASISSPIVQNQGLIEVEAGGTLTVGGAESGSGALQIGGASILDLAGTAAGGQINFLTNAGTLALGAPDATQPSAVQATIAAMFVGDVIDLTSVSGGSADTATMAGTVLSVSDGGTVMAQLNLSPTLSGQTFTTGSDGHGGTLVQMACFAAGTLIETMAGPRPVEALRVGDEVRTVLGGPGTIVWVGSRAVDCAKHPQPENVWPVWVKEGAFGPNMPVRDLWLSPDHAVYVDDGTLIPIKHLINGCTIAQVPRNVVTYYHIELEQHDVVLAEGLPAESYLDTGDRSNFDNGGPVVQAHPDFSTRAWETKACAPLVVTGPILAAVRARLLQRAANVASQPRSSIRTICAA